MKIDKISIYDEILEKFCEIILGEKLPFSIVTKDNAMIIKKGERITANKVRKLARSIGNIYQSKEDPVDIKCLKTKYRKMAFSTWEKIKSVEYTFLVRKSDLSKLPSNSRSVINY